MNRIGPPNFWEGFAKALHLSSKRRGFWAFVPWWLGICLLGSLTIWWVAQDAFSVSERDLAVNVLIGFGVVGGFLGALSIFAMTQIQITCSTYPFSDYLREEDVFETYIFFPQFVLLVQILYILYCMLGCIILLIFPCREIVGLLSVIVVGATLYTVSKTWGLVDLIRVLTWHFEEYTRLLKEAERAAATDSGKQ